MTTQQISERIKLTYGDSTVITHDLNGQGDHFMVEIESTALAAMNRVTAHQGVMAVFKEELKTGELHALSIQIKR